MQNYLLYLLVCVPSLEWKPSEGRALSGSVLYLQSLEHHPETLQDSQQMWNE